MRRIGFLPMVLAGVLVMGACGGAAEDLGNAAQDLEEAADSIDQATDDGMASDDGSTAEIVAVSLPEGWPADFPVPDGAVPVDARESELVSPPYATYSVVFSSQLTDEDLMAFYDEALPAAGWTIGVRYTEDADGLPSFGFQVLKGDWSGSISIGDDVGGFVEGNLFVALGRNVVRDWNYQRSLSYLQSVCCDGWPESKCGFHHHVNLFLYPPCNGLH